jgi:hypothetical protein
LTLMSVSTSRGRTGPRKSTWVGSVCPNSTTSPGPVVPSVGAVAPTSTVCPSVDTDCAGVTCRANAIAAAETTVNTPTATSPRMMRRRTDGAVRGSPVAVDGAGIVRGGLVTAVGEVEDVSVSTLRVGCGL